MISDTARVMNDLRVIVSTLSPSIELNKLEVRLEEVLCNYVIHRKSDEEIENDIFEKLEIYLAARKVEGLSNKTLDGYRIELSNFARYVNKAVVKITTADIRKYLASNSNWMMSTVDSKLSKIKTFFGWLVKEEILLRDPSSKIRSPKKPKRLPKGLSIEELEMVREGCRTKRERALMEVLYSTACRLEEVRNINVSDVNLQERSIRVIGKGDKERIVYLSPKSLYHLNRYLKSRNDNCESLFVTERKPYRRMCGRTIERMVDKIESRVTLSKKLTPHVFRHSAASLMMNNGADLADVQHILGHSSPSTTLIYSHVSEERKQQAHKRFLA